MSDHTEEHQNRLVPASDEEIIGLAEKMWADRALRTIFERVGCDGDMSEAEEATVNGAIDAYRQGPLWDRDGLHLALAPCLLRQLAAGMIENLDEPNARAFLEDRRVVRIGAGMKPVKLTAAEVMSFAGAMRDDSDAWAIFEHLKGNREATEDERRTIHNFETRYRFKYGLLNRDRLGRATALLLDLAAGKIRSLDSPEAWEYVRSSPFIRD